jgi:serine/threonine protein kinase/tetratricopeptide (TPR) repeat protein
MNEPTWDRIKAIFKEALALPADERGPFLDRACAGDDRLRAEVEALLASKNELQSSDPEDEEETAEGAVTESVGTSIGRYKLLQQIGEGGFGTVYMAEQEEPVRRRVALKIIKLGMDTKQVIARFEAERQALALMEHPNIAKVFDAGATDTGRPYFVMELVRGVPITDYCDQNRLGTTERLDLFMAVCGAVQHAHQKGVIHRDIKPTNVMVTLHDGTPVPKIIDFGIAKATNQRLTERTLFTEYNQFIGTPAYMSPEQAEMSGLDVDTRSDIYSLGVLLYELLTGTTPLDTQQFKKAAYTEIQRLIREEEPHRPSVRVSTMGQAATTAAEQRRTDLPGLARALRGDLDWVVMKALEKDRTRRYETANALRMDVQRFLANEPVLASPPGTIYRVRKFVRRNRTGVIVGATVAGALVVGLLMAATGLIQARREAAASQAINEFFNDTLASVDPRQLHQHSGFAREGVVVFETAGVLAQDISVLEMMLKARERIGLSFAGKATLEATARETIGLSLLGLGRPRAAAAELESAAGIRRERLGRNHSDTLRSELQFALSLIESGRAPEAVLLLAELREKMTGAYGEHDPRTLQSASLYAFALQMDRRHTESDPIFDETLKRQREVLGEDHRDSLDTMLYWASSFMWRNRGAEAEELIRPAYDAAHRRFGPDDVITLWAQNLLGWSLNFQGNRADGEALLRPAMEGLERALGSEHPYTCTAKMGLGRSIRSVGGGEETERLWREALDGLRASEGDASPNIYVINRDLAFLLFERGKPDEGLGLLRRAVEDFGVKYGESHDWTTDNLAYLAEGLQRVGRISEAIEISERVLEIERLQAEEPGANAAALNSYAWDLLTSEPPEVRDPAAALPIAEQAVELAEPGNKADILDTLALALHLNGRHREALDAQREALSLLPPEDQVNRATFAVNVARYLLAVGAEDEANEIVVESVQALATFSDTATEFVSNIGRFSNDLSAVKLFEQAELARRGALDVVRTRWNDDSLAIAGLLYRTGRALLHQGRVREAEEYLREGVVRARETGDDEVLHRNQTNLGEALIHRGRFSEARGIAVEVIERYEAKADSSSRGSFSEEMMMMEARRLLGLALLGSGEVHTAEQHLQQAAYWFRSRGTGPYSRGTEPWRLARAQSAWGGSLASSRRFAEAEPILLRSYEVLEREVGRDSTATVDAGRRVVQLYEAWGKPARANQWRAASR